MEGFFSEGFFWLGKGWCRGVVNGFKSIFRVWFFILLVRRGLRNFFFRKVDGDKLVLIKFNFVFYYFYDVNRKGV